MKKFMVSAFLSLVLCASVLGSSVRSFLPSNTRVPSLPVDSVIGQVAEPDSTSAHELLWRALASEYSFEWTETCLRDDVRQSLVSLFGPWLSEHLPSAEVLLSVSHANSDGSIGIDARVGDSCMSFIVDGVRIVSMKLLAADNS